MSDAIETAQALLKARFEVLGLGDPPVACGLDVVTTQVDEAGAWARIEQCINDGATGWCATTNEVSRLGSKTETAGLRARGHLTEAELCSGDTSLRVRHVSGTGGWWITEVTERADGRSHWRQTVKRRGIDPDDEHVGEKRTLSYRTYWLIEPDVEAAVPQQIQPDAVRFIELSGGSEEVSK